MTYLWFTLIVCFIGFADSLTIVATECAPPNFPAGGGYGPRQESYNLGDVVYYYCDSSNYIGGNFYRRCEDDGDWSGDTPVCDFPADLRLVNQTRSTNPTEDNEARLAIDGDQTTCSSAIADRNTYWMGIFQEPGELIRVMVFTPRGDVAYKVILLKRDGSEISCGIRRESNAPLGWKIHTCPVPNNKDAIGIKLKSLSFSKPLEVCEIRSHVLTAPSCVDPHVHINYGRLNLTRKTASLVCDKGYRLSPETQMECIRNGIWKERFLHCQEPRYDLGERENLPQNLPDNDP